MLSKNILFLGDSITEGELTEGPISGGIITNSDSQRSWIAPVATALSAEYGNSGLGGTGWLAVWANANAPALSTSYSQFFGSHSRLVAGKLSPMPDYVVINHGTNDRLTSDGSVTTAVTNILPSIRAAVNTSTPIFVIVPFGQFKWAAITAGVTGDSNTHLVNLGASFANSIDGTGTSPEASDGFHPFAATDARLGAEVARLILLNIIQGGSTISGRAVISGNVTIR